MKKLLLFLLAPMVLFSCNEDADPVQTLVGDWELVSMGSSWTGQVTEEADMEWEQTYQFRADGTFAKTQKSDGNLREASGIYTTAPIEGADSQRYRLTVVLEFVSGDEIAGSCYQDSEILRLSRDRQLKNSWSECDGPTLTYEKK